MSDTTRRIREMSVVVESTIPEGVTLDEYRSSRRRTIPAAQGRGWSARLARRRPSQQASAA